MLVFCSPRCIKAGDFLYDSRQGVVSHKVSASKEVPNDLYSILAVSIAEGVSQEAQVSKFTLLPIWIADGILGERHVPCSIV